MRRAVRELGTEGVEDGDGDRNPLIGTVRVAEPDVRRDAARLRLVASTAAHPCEACCRSQIDQPSFLAG